MIAISEDEGCRQFVQCAVGDTLEIAYIDFGGGINAGGSMTIEYVGP